MQIRDESAPDFLVTTKSIKLGPDLIKSFKIYQKFNLIENKLKLIKNGQKGSQKSD